MADTMILERVESNLTRLRLPRIREILSQMIKVAEDQSKSFLSLFLYLKKRMCQVPI